MSTSQTIELGAPDEGMIVEIMVGEQMEFTLGILNKLTKPWSELTADIKQTYLDEAQREAERKIAKMVALVASIDHTVIPVHLVDIKKGRKEITAKCEVSLINKDQSELFQYANCGAMLVLSNPDDYIVEGDIPKAGEDQGNLPLNNFE